MCQGTNTRKRKGTHYVYRIMPTEKNVSHYRIKSAGIILK